MMNPFKKLRDEMFALSFTLGGTGLVLITLSGDTLNWGIWITIASVIAHLIGVLIKEEE